MMLLSPLSDHVERSSLVGTVGYSDAEFSPRTSRRLGTRALVTVSEFKKLEGLGSSLFKT